MQLKEEDIEILKEDGGHSVTRQGINFNLFKTESNFILSISYNNIDSSSLVRKFIIKADGQILSFSESIIPYGKSEYINNYIIDYELVKYCSVAIKSYSSTIKNCAYNNELLKTSAEELGLKKMPGNSPSKTEYVAAYKGGKEL